MYWPDNLMNYEYAHRLSWIAFNGPVNDGLFVLHKCDNRMCIKPKHLYLGTQQDNVNDREARWKPAQWEVPQPTGFLRRF